MHNNTFSKTDLEMIITNYENLFRKVAEFESIDDLADDLSDKISFYDKQLIALLNSQRQVIA